MYLRIPILCLLITLAISSVTAQDDTAILAPENTELRSGLDVFGLETTIASGAIRNQGAAAYTSIEVFAEAYDSSGELIGEGFGYKVDACGVALLDFALQPGESGRFEAPIELFEDGEIDRVEIIAQGVETDPEPLNLLSVFTGLSTVTREEVVQVEWLEAGAFRYAVGCDLNLFLEWDWMQYDMAARQSTPIEHPAVSYVTEAMIRESGINSVTQGDGYDETLFDTSSLIFHPYGRRGIYETDLHTIITIEPDGTFRRLVHDGLYQYSLQGFIWLPESRFLAYYFGAYGEPVRYFTATADGQLISGRMENNLPSVTVPGPTPEANFAVIGGDFDGQRGYWLYSLINGERTLLFEVDELPGNNYPAPAYYAKDPQNRFIYLVRPVDGQATLQCYARDESTLHTLTALPLQLSTDDRAWVSPSPDWNTLAIHANGENGGLWLVDLNAFDVCR